MVGTRCEVIRSAGSRPTDRRQLIGITDEHELRTVRQRIGAPERMSTMDTSSRMTASHSSDWSLRQTVRPPPASPSSKR
ncbi:MAG: hypothetical protein ACLS69_04710 [Butyricicoccus sp.]